MSVKSYGSKGQGKVPALSFCGSYSERSRKQGGGSLPAKSPGWWPAVIKIVSTGAGQQMNHKSKPLALV